VHGDELWKSDGTWAGTELIQNINPGPYPSNPSYLINVKGTLYFSARSAYGRAELWKSDGTAAGTKLVKDIYRGSLGSRPSGLTDFDGTLLFFADDGAHPRSPELHELWRSDGTAAGTKLVKDFYPGTA